MNPFEPLSLRHAWLIHDRQHRFALGRIFDCASPVLGEPVRGRCLGFDAVGRWECDLSRDRLTWSDEVYDIFGLPRGDQVSRAEAVSLYCEHSRAVMEGLRADALRRNQGFILDAEIRPGHGKRRWMRLIAMPDCENGMVVRLRGLKRIL